jgi:hypothetical protein
MSTELAGGAPCVAELAIAGRKKIRTPRSKQALRDMKNGRGVITIFIPHLFS